MASMSVGGSGRTPFDCLFGRARPACPAFEVGWSPARRSTGRRRQPGKPRERGGELFGPRPAALQPQIGATGMEGKASASVQGPIAQPLGLKALKLAAQQQGVGQGEEQLRDQHQLQPDGVHLKVAERK